MCLRSFASRGRGFRRDLRRRRAGPRSPRLALGLVLALLCSGAAAGPAPASPGPLPASPGQAAARAHARGLVSTLATAPGPWRLPADGPVAALFVAPSVRWGPGHRGVDLRVGVGAPVLAPQDGVVAFIGRVVDRGVVTIRHADGLLTSLEPVTPGVAVGDEVEAGSTVAVLSDESGHCDGCLHWGVRRGSDYLDPLGLLGREPVVLLPVPVSPGRPPAGTCEAAAWPRCASGRSGTP